MALSSQVMAVLLNFRAIRRYLPKNQITEFRPEILFIEFVKEELSTEILLGFLRTNDPLSNHV